jgi:hypothetical protein
MVVAALQPWESNKRGSQPCKGSSWEKPLQGCDEFFDVGPRVVAALQPWAEISERLRR